MEKEKLYSGISKCAWGYFFMYFDINLNAVSILPSFVGFWLFLGAIALLEQEERELKLLRPLGVGLLCWHLISWGLSWVNITPENLIPAADVVICVINLYFHFQLVTNLAAIAARHQGPEASLDRRLLSCRTMQTVVFTLLMVLERFAGLFGDLWIYLSFLLIIVYLIAGIRIMSALFALRKELAQ